MFGSTPVVSAEVEVAYRAPPDVKELKFVPPFAVDKVPDKVTAPVEAVLGIKPVVPALNDVTPLAPLPTLAQLVPLYPSNCVLELLKRKNPTSGTASLCAVVPAGVLNDPVVEVLNAAEAAEVAASEAEVAALVALVEAAPA